MKVIVGSKNPVKLEATRMGFQTVFPDVVFEFVPYEVSSGVSEQPMGMDETKTGAYNRAVACKEAYLDADFSVGIEGGLEEIEGGYWGSEWACVISNDGRIGLGRSGAFLLPPQITNLIKDGMELGYASGKVFGDVDLKRKGGTIGALTGGIMDRTEFYLHSLIFALIPHTRPELYTDV